MKLISTLIFFLICCLSNAQKAGTLDSSFGVNGKVIMNFNVGTITPAFFTGHLDSDNKIIEIASHADGYFAVRYNENGSIDTSFGDNGSTLIKIPNEDYGEVHGLAIQSDGKILISGNGSHNFLHPVHTGYIIRLNTDGSVDPLFGINGKITLSTNSQCGYYLITIQTDGRIIVVGSNSQKTFLNRFSLDGQFDVSFGVNGYAYLNYTAYYIGACKLQSDGKIVLGGGFYYSGSRVEFWLERFLNDGSVDKSFGNNGIVLTDYSSWGNLIRDVSFQSDGKIVAIGIGNVSTIPFIATARYNNDGSLDSSFGEDGKASIIFPDTVANANTVAITDNNQIIIGGYVSKYNSADLFDYMLIKLQSNGSVDSTFGTNGLTITDFNEGNDKILSVCIQSSGKIVAIGSSDFVDVGQYSSLARYNNDDLTKKQTIIKKIKHYAATHNNAQATSLNNVSIYPNPAQNTLHITGLSPKAKLTIVDVAGNIKLQAVANTSSYNLNIASLNTGNYLLKIEMNGAVVSKQFIKQ